MNANDDGEFEWVLTVSMAEGKQGWTWCGFAHIAALVKKMQSSDPEDKTKTVIFISHDRRSLQVGVRCKAKCQAWKSWHHLYFTPELEEAGDAVKISMSLEINKAKEGTYCAFHELTEKMKIQHGIHEFQGEEDLEKRKQEVGKDILHHIEKTADAQIRNFTNDNDGWSIGLKELYSTLGEDFKKYVDEIAKKL